VHIIITSEGDEGYTFYYNVLYRGREVADLLWPPKARPLYFTAVIIIFYFVSIDERRAMESQPNLASRSEVVSMYKCPQNFEDHSPNAGRKKTSNFGPLLSRLPHSTPHISGKKRRMTSLFTVLFSYIIL